MASYDWKLTEDGDLDVGMLETDEEGNQYYVGLDREVSTEWEEESKEVRDIGYVFDIDTEAQLIKNRLKTENPDWYHHMAIGANLSDLIGLPNTRETSLKGIEQIKIALMYKNLYNLTQIDIKATPLNVEQILFLIEVTRLNERIVEVPLVFNLETGVSNIYEIPKKEEQEEDFYDEDQDVELEIVEVEQEDTSDTEFELEEIPSEEIETDDEEGSGTV